MSYKICNPKEDQYGNSKENIFLAFDEEGSYLGSAYAYPRINHHQTYETPYLIFIGLNIENIENQILMKEIKQSLFNKVLSRAKELRKLEPELKCRIYSGFENNPEEMKFYLENGLQEDYTIIMESDILITPNTSTLVNIKVDELEFTSEEALMDYKAIYDEIFVSPLDIDSYREQEKLNCFKNLSFHLGNQKIGGCTIFEKDGYGYIETMFIASANRGKGYSKFIMEYMLNYFYKKGFGKVKLEVWELDKRAVQLYKKYGFKEIQKNLMFPGITL